MNDRTKPDVDVPVEAPTELVCTDLIEGSGTEAVPSSTVEVHYVGVGQMSDIEFDSSWSRGATTTFPLNAVIQGWSEGLVGMKEGGRRHLAIPADQAYGNNPPPGAAIQPGESLIFVVDLVSVM